MLEYRFFLFLSSLIACSIKKVKMWRFIVRYLARSYSADSIQLPPGHRTPFIHKPSQLPGEHTVRLPFRRIELFNTQVFTVLPGTHLLLGRESVRAGKVACLGAQRLSIIQPSRRSNPRSLACKSHILTVFGALNW